MKKSLVLALVLALAAAPVWAAGPDAASNPVLANIVKAGAKAFYLGNRSGVDGWFIVKDGQVQIVYATPDNKGAIVGALFGQDGENVSALQVNTLMQGNKEVADLVNAAQREQMAIAQVGSPAPSSVVTPPAPGTIPSAPLSPGERLIHDLSAASSVVLGAPSSPEILMVMDPHCPHCQATWKVLRESVLKGSVHIRMIPIGTQDTDDERAAAVLLGVADPAASWDKYVAGDKAQLVGTPSAAALAAVRSNHALIDNWSIQNTPYIVYRGQDGKVKIVQGEPGKVSLILADLGL